MRKFNILQLYLEAIQEYIQQQDKLIAEQELTPIMFKHEITLL